MKPLLLIIPTRNRPDNIEALLHSFEETKTLCDVIFAIDDDDVNLNEYHALTNHTLWRDNYHLSVNPRLGKGMAKPLNLIARWHMDEYRHFAFIGDDHRPRTENWDSMFVQLLDIEAPALAFGDDLIQGANLPTAIAMSGDVVRALGGMVPDGFIHLYLDNFWKKLGEDLDSLYFVPSIILEHLHPIAGKAEWDSGYLEVNQQEIYTADYKAFTAYLSSPDYQKLVKGLRDKATS